ncbi:MULTISPECIES: ABC transporter ATP-binding protein [unclassified Paenibacillus]|uniref:ABC transporter ATP-binding protein n=1 Tax=unclassified Paenibacillus TaxID=185978 RepID=UPI000953E4C1|nr:MULTISPECIES: ABC transporter ATP-binding protein [unclassified Paenibacillus]ASS67788.1 ABC transporter ATP-binding protein [Paenibacillus sp. RUD330]SIR60737.1 oligopeptide/dipeptide ABC transporter, ATP-binding protein, C-terminal domain-containing protein [Paenibacillus sp. RU4X]SIR69493.1 oligopeptide/dipeptide ABC transporter, ATP-binding protein, C-terminal domain-containing protein [Paenibacillus sp. RU4T]
MPSRADTEKDRVLTVSHLRTVFDADHGAVVSVDDVSFGLDAGETLAIVGESGSGKSVTALSIMRLLGKSGRVESGQIRLGDADLLACGDKELERIRGNRISMIFQEPMTSLNPVFTVGYQLTEAIRLHLLPDKRKARAYAVEMLRKVKLPQPERIMDEYPFALSGGMRQRVMIAMALACKPEVLIADEPTTALDVTVQAQIMRLVKELCAETGTAVILITHDLGVVAEMADRVAVMYAGQVVEDTDVFTLFESPQHPYTQGLLGSIARLEADGDSRLVPIPGTVPSRYEQVKGCRFHDRCPLARENCLDHAPPLLAVEDGHSARCWYGDEAGMKWRRERHG